MALTAAAVVSERDAAFACGMDDFVTKPIDVQALWAALARLLVRRGAPLAEGSGAGTGPDGTRGPHAPAHKASITAR